MTLKSYLWGLRLSTLAAFAALILIINFMDPQKVGIGGLLVFYVSTFIFMSGLAILLFTWLRQRVNGPQEAYIYLGVSFRQGLIISLLLILLLLMQQFRVLTWWDSALAVAGILLIELYFLTRR